MNCTERAIERNRRDRQDLVKETAVFQNTSDLACSSQTFICANNIKYHFTYFDALESLKVSAIPRCTVNVVRLYLHLFFKARVQHVLSRVILLYIPTKCSKRQLVKSGCISRRMKEWEDAVNESLSVSFCLKVHTRGPYGSWSTAQLMIGFDLIV